MTNGRLFMRKKSKRIPTRQRKKTERKVKEHNKKLRKGKIVKGCKKGKSKKLSVPNDCPFKDAILDDIERLKALRQAEKEARGKAAKKLDAEKDVGVHANAKVSGVMLARHIVDCEIGEVRADIVVQCIDARRPFLANVNHDSRQILALTKADLVPPATLKQLLTKLQDMANLPTVALKTDSSCIGSSALLYTLQVAHRQCVTTTQQSVATVALVGRHHSAVKSLWFWLNSHLDGRDFHLLSQVGRLDREPCAIFSRPNAVSTARHLIDNCYNYLQAEYALPDVVEGDTDAFLAVFFDKVALGRQPELFKLLPAERLAKAAEVLCNDFAKCRIRFHSPLECASTSDDRPVPWLAAEGIAKLQCIASDDLRSICQAKRSTCEYLLLNNLSS